MSEKIFNMDEEYIENEIREQAYMNMIRDLQSEELLRENEELNQMTIYYETLRNLNEAE